ncbi:MAG TPA: transketolase C-terminal domain-containing protein [Candidatus Paceibacterota bacterium]|nr:transketolase C-terminal domain-containing protein [Verrucomicrobiota bacterium]HRY51034.1 transketolase C-terminal domain-containing protein [Candidatus Paceibacterota bacterium]HSA01688.1 transketolase C-terminal domain-containing protein [Candidatus Paceibacterota bacterium]
MRNAFAQQITALARQDERIVLLSGDIGNRLFDDFKASCPGRFYNCGVAEANMIGIAAGLALSGLRPVCYTITPFLTYRCMEQIRIDVCYHQAPVVIVGTGAGLSYASLGATHHSCEDMGMLRLLPGLAVIAPADSFEVRAALRAALENRQPVFLRIGKKGEPNIHAADPEFVIGRALPLRPGGELALLCAGTILPVGLAAADLLSARGLSCAVYSFPTIKPLDESVLQQVFSSCRVVATLEEHSILGGLGGAVAEWLSDQPQPRARLCRLGTRDEFLHVTCGQSEAREHFGLTPDRIAERLLHILSGEDHP